MDSAQFSLLYLPKDDFGGEVELPIENEENQHTGRKQKHNPETWKVKHVKKPGLRKNSPLVPLAANIQCCKKNCLQSFSLSHLTYLRDTFQTLLYDEQNIYLNGLLHRQKTVKTSGHPRKNTTGKKIGRPPAEASQFIFVIIYWIAKT